MEIKDTNLDITHGNVLNQQDIESVMSEIDIVISALNTDGTNTLTESMRMILETMKKKQM